jgi:hypothetical protein
MNNQNTKKDNKINGFIIGYLIGILLLYKGCGGLFIGTESTFWEALIPFLIIFGAVFAFLGSFIGKNISANENSKNIVEFIANFYSKNKKTVLLISTIGVILISSYYFINKEKEPPCLDNLRDTKQCENWLQGYYSWLDGREYSGTLWVVSIKNNYLQIIYKLPNKDSKIVREGEFYIDENIETGTFNEHEFRRLRFKSTNEDYFMLSIGVTKFNPCGVLSFMRQPTSGNEPGRFEDYFVRSKD